MLQAEIFTSDTRPPFTVSPSSANYWTELLCYELSTTLHGLKQQGFGFSKPVQADFDGLSGELDAYAEDFVAYMKAAINGQASTDDFDLGLIPIILECIPLIISGGWGGVFALFVRVGIYVLSGVVSEREQAGKSGGISDEDVNRVLERLDAMIAQDRILEDSFGKTLFVKSHIVEG